MTKRLKIGERVSDEYLGSGTIVKQLPGDFYSVLWDVRPAWRYNLGENPCLWWPKPPTLQMEE